MKTNKKKQVVSKKAATTEAPVKDAVMKKGLMKTDSEPTIKKKIVPKVDQATAEKKVKKEKVRTTVTPPTNFPEAIGKVKNPLISKKRMKKALAVAIIRECPDKAKAAKAIRNSGIPFKQVSTPDEVKSPVLLSKAEWQGTNWASWATFNADTYYKNFKEAVEECVPFAKALLAQKND